MIIEEYKPYIEGMLISEPWRDGGPKEGALCEGHIDWDGSKYWTCSKCGRIGTSSVQIHHPPTCSPAERVFSALWK